MVECEGERAERKEEAEQKRRLSGKRENILEKEENVWQNRRLSEEGR